MSCDTLVTRPPPKTALVTDIQILFSVDVDVHSRGGHVLPCSSLNVMTSKGKREKAGGAAAVVEEPPEREVVPGKITESQW